MCKLFNSLGHMHGIPAGNYVSWGRWSCLHHDQNNGYQHTLKCQQHSAASYVLGTRVLSDTRPVYVWGMNTWGNLWGRGSFKKKKKKLWSTREQISSRSETLHSTHHPPPRVYSTVSPMWRSRGNGFDLLHPEPLSLGVKQKIGQWDRMFLDNFSCERGSTPLCLRLSAGLCGKCGRSASLSWLQDLKRMNRGSQRGQHSFEMYG